MNSLTAAAAQQLLLYKSAEESYLDFVKVMYPSFTFPEFHVELITALDKLERRQLFINSSSHSVLNLLVTMPPRHAKTTWGTINFPAYFLGRDPRRHVMSLSYNAHLAKGFGRQVRSVMSEPTYKNIFPNCTIASDKRAADSFITDSGGNYYSIGINGTTTGRAANLLLIDDPLKSRQEAESKLIRDRVWDFYTGSLSNRREPELSGMRPIQIVILTRWHPDDLAGRIMETDEWHQGLWHHINFPALTEIPDSDPKQYKALWPDRFPVVDLMREKAKSERDFESLYQQHPVVIGGNLIKTEWFNRYSEPLDSYLSIIITADTAFQKTTASDFTVFAVLGLTRDGDIHLLDVRRGKWDFPEAKKIAIALNTVYRGKGLRGIYIENRASGQSLIQELRSASGLAVLPYNVGHTDKIARVNLSLPIIEGGRVFIPEKAPWLDDFLRETSQFPSSTHDDIVDAFIMGIDVLSRMGLSTNQIEQLFDLGSSLASAPLMTGGESLNSLVKKGKVRRPLGF